MRPNCSSAVGDRPGLQPPLLLHSVPPVHAPKRVFPPCYALIACSMWFLLGFIYKSRAVPEVASLRSATAVQYNWPACMSRRSDGVTPRRAGPCHSQTAAGRHNAQARQFSEVMRATQLTHTTLQLLGRRTSFDPHHWISSAPLSLSSASDTLRRRPQSTEESQRRSPRLPSKEQSEKCDHSW